jgi:D-apionolactonase
MALSKNIIYYGSASDLPEQIPLNAGPLSMVFENGDLRNIRLSGTEAINRIYVAIRDKNWGTVLPVITKLEIKKANDSFHIGFDVENREADIVFTWKGEIVGSDTGELCFSMKGFAQTKFLRNRIGFCVLHPRSCAGSVCKVTRSSGTTTESHLSMK